MSETNGHTATRLSKAQRRLVETALAASNALRRCRTHEEWLVSSERRAHWLAMTTLLPPEQRGFSPALEGDEKPPQLDLEYERRIAELRRKAEKIRDQAPLVDPNDLPYPLPPTWSLPARGEDDSPGWHNVIRALEEDR